MFSITCFGFSASMYLVFNFFVSWSKSEVTLLALYSSPAIAFLLYLKGIFEDQCTGNLFCFIINLRLNSLVRAFNFSVKKLICMVSNVRLIFSCSQEFICYILFSSHISVIHVSIIKYWVGWYNYIFLHFAYINIWKNYRYQPTHRTAIDLLDKSVHNALLLIENTHS